MTGGKVARHGAYHRHSTVSGIARDVVPRKYECFVNTKMNGIKTPEKRRPNAKRTQKWDANSFDPVKQLRRTQEKNRKNKIPPPICWGAVAKNVVKIEFKTPHAKLWGPRRMNMCTVPCGTQFGHISQQCNASKAGSLPVPPFGLCFPQVVHWGFLDKCPRLYFGVPLTARARDALEGGRYPPAPPPLQGAQPMPSHCPPDAKCQPQWHL